MDNSPIVFEIATWARECIEGGSSDWSVVIAHIHAKLEQLAPNDIVALNQQMALILDVACRPVIEQQ
jgi:hypothetical protein